MRFRIVGGGPFGGRVGEEAVEALQRQQMAQSDLCKDNPKLERLDRKIRVLRTNLQYINLRGAYDFVVLDAPPVTLIADAFELMRYSDVNMFVMRQGVKPRSFLSLVEGMHQSKQIKNGCVVLNDYQANLATNMGTGTGITTTDPKIGINPGLIEYLGGGVVKR
jgi:succinoglycan biosynthesis transport protein ExoP